VKLKIIGTVLCNRSGEISWWVAHRVTASVRSSVVVGRRVTTSTHSSVVVGRRVTTSAHNSVLVGRRVTTSTHNSVLVGGRITTSIYRSAQVGRRVTTSTHSSVLVRRRVTTSIYTSVLARRRVTMSIHSSMVHMLWFVKPVGVNKMLQGGSEENLCYIGKFWEPIYIYCSKFTELNGFGTASVCISFRNICLYTKLWRTVE
jgi:hypothetical protein